MYLIGDIGNTDIKIFLFNTKFKIIKKIRFSTESLSNKFLYRKLKFLNTYKKQNIKILFCSVVPKSYNLIKLNIKKILKKPCYELKNYNLNKLVKIKVNKKQIGSDRLANAISVLDNKSNFIIVDFGTATNFDIVIKNKYIGGIIAPGIILSLNNLINKASLIPETKLEKIKNVIGKNTNTAIRSGFYHGYSGLIDNIIKLIIKQTDKSFKIIFTGGLSHLFKNSIKRKVKIEKDLTINGVLKVAKNSK